LAADERPAVDPACAGCGHLVTFRALRRAGIGVRGGLGCEPEARGARRPANGRWAHVATAAELARAGAGVLSKQAAGGCLIVVADAPGARSVGRVVALLSGAGLAVRQIDSTDAAGAEREVRRATSGHGVRVLVALTPCRRGVRRGPPMAIDAARCNRCGACLSLACPAISDAGGDSLEIAASVCSGCGLCEPLCRAGAIRHAALGG
jgi:TPP-dependent indolepyruvate ferredoxin oxidoreductase alpha subunit